MDLVVSPVDVLMWLGLDPAEFLKGEPNRGGGAVLSVLALSEQHSRAQAR